jgi:glycosyltransferase involved in cell wall biosynthesis
VQVLPNVSVCIPAYRGENFLAETMHSVLDQTYANFELVILDNASPDETGEIARSFRDPRVRVVTNEKTIPAPDNWRRAVELCSAPLVKLVCADDLLHPRCLELQAAAMEADPGLAMVAGRRHMIDESSRVLAPARGLKGLIGVRSGVEVARRVVRSGINPIGEPGSVLFRRADYTAVGGWSPLRPFTMDLDLWMRLLRCGDFLGLPDALAAFRIGRQSMTVNNDDALARDQKAVIAGLVARPELHVRRIDVAIGQLLTPFGRMRRRLLFSSANRSGDQDEQPPQTPIADVGR